MQGVEPCNAVLALLASCYLHHAIPKVAARGNLAPLESLPCFSAQLPCYTVFLDMQQDTCSRLALIHLIAITPHSYTETGCTSVHNVYVPICIATKTMTGLSALHLVPSLRWVCLWVFLLHTQLPCLAGRTHDFVKFTGPTGYIAYQSGSRNLTQIQKLWSSVWQSLHVQLLVWSCFLSPLTTRGNWDAADISQSL